MNKNKSLANRLREVLLDGKWIANTNYKEQITATNWQQAIHQIGNLNTIAMLTFHINYYLKGIIQVFEGGSLDIKDSYSFDLPEIKSEQDWHDLVADFLTNAEAFINHVALLPDALLEQPFVEAKYGSYQRNVEGVIEHAYYHLGQIVWSRKMQNLQ